MSLTTREAVENGEARLRQAGVTSPAWDAELLLRHVMGWERATFLARYSDPLTTDSWKRFDALIGERAGRRPLQHITGLQSFWRHDFEVTPGAMIPRQETEILVQTTLDLANDIASPHIVDVGTGSGCIALSLACERQDATIDAVDISADALDVARQNARHLECGVRVRFHLGDLLAAETLPDLPFDLIVSNPPYIDPREFAGLPPEVRDHDPRIALVAPGGRFSVYRRLIPQAMTRLKPGGFLVLELGHEMMRGVRDLCVEAGFVVERQTDDLQGIPRSIAVRRRAR